MFATHQKPRLGRRRSSIPIIESQPCSVISIKEKVEAPGIVNPPNSKTSPKAVTFSNKVTPIIPAQDLEYQAKLELSKIPRQLRRLACTEQVIIKQIKEESLESIDRYEVESRYKIYNEDNQLIYIAEESSQCSDSKCLILNCCGSLNLVVKIQEPNGSPVMFFECPLPLQEVCCLQSMDVRFSSGKRFGFIKQTWQNRAELRVVNGKGETEFLVNGPPRNFSWRTENVEFPIFEPDGETERGRISKRWGFLHRAFQYPESQSFGIKFPPDICPTMKALLIGTAFLVDYMYLDGRCHGGPPEKFSPFDVLHRNVVLHQDPSGAY